MLNVCKSVHECIWVHITMNDIGSKCMHELSNKLHKQSTEHDAYTLLSFFLNFPHFSFYFFTFSFFSSSYPSSDFLFIFSSSILLLSFGFFYCFALECLYRSRLWRSWLSASLLSDVFMKLMFCLHYHSLTISSCHIHLSLSSHATCGRYFLSRLIQIITVIKNQHHDNLSKPKYTAFSKWNVEICMLKYVPVTCWFGYKVVFIPSFWANPQTLHLPHQMWKDVDADCPIYLLVGL